MNNLDVPAFPASPPSPYETVRVDETRIRRTYSSADIAALIQADLLNQTIRYSKAMLPTDRFEVDYGKLPDGIEAQLIVPGAGY